MTTAAAPDATLEPQDVAVAVRFIPIDPAKCTKPVNPCKPDPAVHLHDARQPYSTTPVSERKLPAKQLLLPCDRIRQGLAQLTSATSMRPLVVLVACGAFNPVTNMHLRMFETARDFLMCEQNKYDIVGGLMSPVHDQYPKKGLIPGTHRHEMCRRATESSTWMATAAWEVAQPEWSRTVSVLLSYQAYLNANCRDPFGRTIQVKLLAGADLLQSMLEPNVWQPGDLEVLVEKLGLVIVERAGCRAANMVFDHDFLFQHRDHIDLVPQRIENNISSTIVRRHLARGLSIKYLIPDGVEDYIRHHRLYSPDRDGDGDGDALAVADV